MILFCTRTHFPKNQRLGSRSWPGPLLWSIVPRGDPRKRDLREIGVWTERSSRFWVVESHVFVKRAKGLKSKLKFHMFKPLLYSTFQFKDICMYVCIGGPMILNSWIKWVGFNFAFHIVGGDDVFNCTYYGAYTSFNYLHF